MTIKQITITLAQGYGQKGNNIMKKINVSNLIDLRTRENEVQKSLNFWKGTKIAFNGLKVEAYEKELAEIREQFAAESEKLASVIAEAEGARVSARKIDVKDIIDDLIEINDYLGISTKAMKGTTVHVDHNAQAFPNAYKGTPESTHFTAEFTSGWFVTAIYRSTCIRRKYELKLSESAKEEYLRNAETLA